MIDKIKKLAASPIMGSDQDIKNFIKIMEFTRDDMDILLKSKDIIKRYYITGNIDDSEESVIDKALSIINPESDKDTQTHISRESGIPEKTSKSMALSKEAQEILKLVNDEEKSYFSILADVVDAYGEKKIDIDDIKRLAPKLKIHPLDIKTIYAYFYKDNQNLIHEICVGKTLQDSGLTYLQIALLILDAYNRDEMDEEMVRSTAKERGIDNADIDSLYDLLYAKTYISPSEDEIATLSKDYEMDDFYITTNIPAKKRVNFKEAVQYNINEKIIVLIDMTFFGRANNAIAITVNGLYWNNDDILEDQGFISWQEFFSSDIEASDENDNHIIIGQKHTIDRLGSDMEREDILEYLNALQSLKKTEEEESEAIEPDMDLNEVYKKPYENMENLIFKAFLYAAPVNTIVRHFSQYNINNVEESDYDISREYIMLLSDKNKLEEMIVESEKNFLTFFQTAITSTRQDIISILGRDIGQIFALNEQIVDSLKQEMVGYRSIVGGKMAEMNHTSQQLKHYWSENEEGTGKIMTDVLKGGSLGMIGASLLGPVGIAVAVGANYLNDKDKEKKKDSMHQTLFDNWASAHDSFYFVQLKEYDEKYKVLIANISQQFIDNYKQAYKLAIESNKKREVSNYFKEELKDLVTEESFISMRRELTEHEAMFE